jgi:hypothetical protein
MKRGLPAGGAILVVAFLVPAALVAVARVGGDGRCDSCVGLDRARPAVRTHLVQ